MGGAKFTCKKFENMTVKYLLPYNMPRFSFLENKLSLNAASIPVLFVIMIMPAFCGFFKI